jgi:hypothetical protein
MEDQYSQAFNFKDLPLDILPCILSFMTDRRDCYAACLVNRTFNHIATPLLYDSIDATTSKTGELVHPSSTLLNRPELATFVHQVQEDRSFIMSTDFPKALRLCVNLRSASWFDDGPSDFNASALVTFLSIMRDLPHVEELRIRSRTELPAYAWEELRQLCGLKSVSIWTLEGPPPILQGWVENMAGSLTKLELGRCAGVPPTLLIGVCMRLPLLQELTIKGVSSGSLATLISYLPNLTSLDTDLIHSSVMRKPPQPLPSLTKLNVRLSLIKTLEKDDWWNMMSILSPTRDSASSLVELALDSKSVTWGTVSRLWPPWIMELGERQRRVPGGQAVLEKLLIECVELSVDSVELIVTNFPALKELRCTVASSDLASMKTVFSRAQGLSVLQMNFHQVFVVTAERQRPTFTIEDAREMMQSSLLRLLIVGGITYQGQWALTPSGGVVLNITEERAGSRPVETKNHALSSGGLTFDGSEVLYNSR